MLVFLLNGHFQNPCGDTMGLLCHNIVLLLLLLLSWLAIVVDGWLHVEASSDDGHQNEGIDR
jgi:hypothetical protein